MEAIEVRPIAARDAPEMARIIRRVMTEFGAVGAGYSIEDAEVDDMFAAYRASDRAFFVALRGRELFGGAGIAPLEKGPAGMCELRKMYVLDAARGLGVGRRLLELCLAAACERGFHTCYLETLATMTQARRLYEKFGFTPIASPLGCTGHHGCDAWYVLDLVRLGDTEARDPSR